MNYIVSFPRSGNTWLRYIVEAISQRPTLGCIDSEPDTPIYQRTDSISVDSSADPIARKSHWWSDIEDRFESDSGLVLLLRNYKEAIIRHVYYRKNDIDEEERALHVRRYMTPVERFDSHEGPKELVYYKDLIEEPVGVANQLSDLFGFRGDDIQRFAENVDYHTQSSIEMYDRKQGSHSEGNSEVYHSRNVEETELRDWDERFSSHAPELYEEYLSHYRTT